MNEYPELYNESYVLHDHVMTPLAAQLGQKLRSDRGTRRGCPSTSSSTFDQPSSSHHNDEDDGNDEGTSRAITPSPIRYVNSLTNQVPQFCEMKRIKREFSVARTSQQNGVPERKNRTLIEATRTMLVDSKLPTTFWAEAVNTACYVLNRVLVIKPHNKTPYELIRGRPPLIDFMKPFGCPVTILNTRDHLGKFDGKADEGYFVGYSVGTKLMVLQEPKITLLQVKLKRKKNLNLPICTTNPLISQGPKDSKEDAGSGSLQMWMKRSFQIKMGKA
ncbi:ribonuclease H-like domain-containing protein [Tanacetum coccineum]